MKRLTIFGMLAVFIFTGFISLFNPATAYAGSNAEYRERRVLSFFADQCLNYIDTNDPNDDFGDMWTDNADEYEFVVVGLDMDSGNGVWTCKTVTLNAMKIIDTSLSGSSNTRIENKFCEAIIGQGCTDKGDEPSGSVKKENVEALRARAVELRNARDEGTDEQKASVVEPFLTLCYTFSNEEPSSNYDPGGDDFSAKIEDGTTIYAQLNSGVGAGDVAEVIELGEIFGKAFLGILDLGFDYGGGGDVGGNFSTGTGDNKASDFIPLGRDFGHGVSNYRHDAIVDCGWIKANRDWIFSTFLSIDDEGVLSNEAGAIVNNNPDQQPDSVDDTKTCAGESGSTFGWILCPVIEHAYEFLDWIYKNAMEPVLRLDLSEADELGEIWSGFRLMANMIFVIAFIIVIYSAATGNLMSAYDVRKLLPRLFIVAILVQLSFFLSITALQISNEVGAGVQNIMLLPLDGELISIPSLFGNFGGTPNGLITEGVVAVGSGLVVIILLALALFFSVSGIVILIGVFLIRDVGILMLIVVSPVAFALAILPGTDGYFKKWWKWYFGLLAMYPIMAAFLASGQLFAGVINDSGTSIFGNAFLRSIIATIVLFVPFFVAPQVLKFAGQAMGSVVGIMNGVKDGTKKVMDSDLAGKAKLHAKGKAWDVGGNRAISAVNRGGRLGRMAGKGMVTSRARTQQGIRKLEDEQKAASEILGEDQIAKWRAEGGEAVKAGKVGKIDNYVVGKLSEIATDDTGRYNEGQKRAAATQLATLYGTDEGAVGVLRGIVEKRADTTATAAQQQFAQKVLSDNKGAFGGDMPHVYKGLGTEGVKSTLEMDIESVLGFKKSALRDMLSVDEKYDAAKGTLTSDAAGQAANVQRLAQRYIDAAGSDQTRGQINSSSVQDIRKALSPADQAAFDKVFDPTSGRVL